MKTANQQTKSNISKIVFYGPESTGKTTLAKKMAEHFKTEWVPEFMRTYLQDKLDKTGKRSEKSDIRPMVKGQLISENKLIKDASKFLFCDTNPLEVYVYAKIYFPDADFSWLDKLNMALNYDYYFLTYIDTPWVADNLRDKPKDREMMYQAFLDELKRRNKNFTILKGDIKTRTKTVIKTLKAIA